MLDKNEFHARMIQLIANEAEARKNAIPAEAPDRMEQRQAINDERNELFQQLHRYLWKRGKKNTCVGCPFYEVFADWLCDTDQERLPVLQEYLADKKLRRQLERTLDAMSTRKGGNAR